MENLQLFSIADLQALPAEMYKMQKKPGFYCHVPIPLPEQIVILAKGEWPLTVPDLTVAMQVGRDLTFSLGKLTNTSRCLMWERSACKENLPTQSKRGLHQAKVTVEMEASPAAMESEEPPTSSSQKPPLATESSPSSAPQSPAKATPDDLGAETTLDSPGTESPETSGKPEEKENRQAINEATPQTQTSLAGVLKKPKKGRAKREKSPETPMEDPTPIKRKSGTRQRVVADDHCTPSRGAHLEKKKRVIAKDLISSGATPEGTKVAHCKDVTSRAGSLPSNRWGHTLVWVGGQQAILIGGQGDRQQLSRDSIWTLATDTRRWRNLEVSCENQKPECRMGHSATFDPTLRCIYVYGGSKNLKWFHDVHMFDIDKWNWQLMKVNGKAPMRAYHSATLHRHEVWVFGGVYPRPNPNPDGCSNELHIFSPINENWYTPLVTGNKPEPRSGHSANLIDDQLVVFGGWDFPICFNDLHILDMTTLDWSKPVVHGQPPKPRSWHASSTLSQRRILIHGGYDGDNALDDCFIFTLASLSWNKIAVHGAPCPRAGHTALALPYYHDNEDEDEVLLFGGGDNDGIFFNDLYSLYVPFKPSSAEAK